MSAKWLKWTIAVAGAAIGAAAVVGKLASEKKKDEDLDEFLLPDENEETEYEAVPSLTKDIQSWQDVQSENFNVEIHFGFENSDSATQFQEALAKEGLSSDYNAEDSIVNVLYSEDTTMEGLNFLAATLEDASIEYEAQYQGFKFL